MKRFPATLLLTIALAILLGACTAEQATNGQQGQDANGVQGAELMQANVEREASAGVDSENVQELVAGNNRLAFDLYHALAGESENNVIYSPFSISAAFSMVYGGARGETEAQMAEVLHTLPQEAQHPAFNALDQHLASLSEAQGGAQAQLGDAEGNSFQLNVSNAVWVQEGYPVRNEFLDLVARQYGAGLWSANFEEAPDAAAAALNAWVNEATEGRIEQLSPPLMLSSNTRMVLANAIYFQGSWLYRFQEGATEDGPFTLLDGSTVTVPMMQGRPRLPYFEGENFAAASMPYWGNAAEMLIILPDEGQWQNVEESLQADLIDNIRQNAELYDVTLQMPRFEFDTTIMLKDLLQQMGMTNPFSQGANFEGMVEGGGLFIADAVHKGTITVDEEGTEAAAVTGVAMEESAYPTAELTLDRPFVFAIVERETGVILFVGRVMNPA